MQILIQRMPDFSFMLLYTLLQPFKCPESESQSQGTSLIEKFSLTLHQFIYFHIHSSFLHFFLIVIHFFEKNKVCRRYSLSVS